MGEIWAYRGMYVLFTILYSTITNVFCCVLVIFVYVKMYVYELNKYNKKCIIIMFLKY